MIFVLASLSSGKCWFASSRFFCYTLFLWRSQDMFHWRRNQICNKDAQIKLIMLNRKFPLKFVNIFITNFTALPVELVAPLLDGTGIFKLLENVLDFFMVPEPSLSRNDVFVMARDLVSFDSVALLLILELLLHGTWFPATPFVLVWDIL